MAVGDWSRPSGNIVQRGFQNYHWYCCDVLFHIIGSGQHVHPIWDIPQWYVRRRPPAHPSSSPHPLHRHTAQPPPTAHRYDVRGIKLVERKFFRQLGVNMYECTIGEKTK